MLSKLLSSSLLPIGRCRRGRERDMEPQMMSVLMGRTAVERLHQRERQSEPRVTDRPEPARRPGVIRRVWHAAIRGASRQRPRLGIRLIPTRSDAAR